MKYREFENTVGERIFNILGEWNTKRAALCKKCFNKRMTIENTVSHIILNS
jgi:hypothetical protein